MQLKYYQQSSDGRGSTAAQNSGDGRTATARVNCPFYFKIGACRHGNRCSRLHVRPNISQTVLIPHMYQPPPPMQGGSQTNDTEHFADFCDEVLEELQKFGQVEELNVCQNLGDHLFGNVYVKYMEEEAAEKAIQTLQGRYYAGQLLHVEYSPVTDFRESRCRQYDENKCKRGGYCNFMHLKDTPDHLKEYFREMRKRSRHRERERMERRRNRKRRTSHERDDGEDYNELSMRSNSVERRKLIAKWNKERERMMKNRQGDMRGHH